MHNHQNSQSRKPEGVQRYFSGITEYTFQTQLGIPDTRLIDYLSKLLTRFVRSEVVFKIRDLTGRPLTEVAEMLIEAEARMGDAKRDIHQHIGDFILFWSGVYPEAIKRMRGEDRKDHLINYWAEGKNAYLVASRIQAEYDEEGADLMGQLSTQFELCAYGLGEVRREWERRDDGTRLFVA
ncbi:MAG: hypothetical protein COA78_32355 [Blastopirellula sp.]|nr:MAG: hypothetical protein COA78_32355 [Blastopirellula sp.]